MTSIEKPLNHRKRNLRFLFAVLFLILVASMMIVFRGVGWWLVREDPLAHADAIVVLSGGLPYRAEGAAHCFESGYASEVWITRPEGPVEELKDLGIHYVGEEEYSRMVLIRLHVPENDAFILPRTIINTEQEVEEIVRELRNQGKTSVIIVTSPQHTRRVKALWKKLAGTNLTAIVRSAPEDPFDADHWWRDTRSALSVARELLGLINVWAGLPVRPHAD